MSRAQLHIRMPVAEKGELREEAVRYGISMSALVRIDILQAREVRAGEEMINFDLRRLCGNVLTLDAR